MASYQSYCLKPDYFKGASGWANSSTIDQWLIKNRGTEVKYNNSLNLYVTSFHYNRDETHGAFMAFIQKNINIAVTNDRGSSIYFQCKGV